MQISEQDILMGIGLVAGLVVALQALRLTWRVCDHYPLVGLGLSLAFLGWMYQNPDALSDLVSDSSPDALAQIQVQSIDAESQADDGMNVSDDELVDYYMQQNIHFAHEVKSAPGKARRTVGL